jgi:pyruvate,water dikinase
MLESLRMYLRGEGANPHERQRGSEALRRQTAEAVLGRLRGLRRWVFRKALSWAQSLSEAREDALADIGLGYPVLRQVLHELGRRLAQAGAIRQPENIFWLERLEVENGAAMLDRGVPLDLLAERVAERQAFVARARQATPPPMLPMKTRPPATTGWARSAIVSADPPEIGRAV